MLITEQDLANICIDIMQKRDADNRYSLRGGTLSRAMFEEFVKEGRVTLEVENATQIRKESSGLQHQGACQGASSCQNGEEVRREESPKDRRSDCAGQSAQIGRQERPIIYIAGPMGGLPERNFPAFHRCAAHLRAQGYAVLNPAEINTVGDGRSMREIVQRDLGALLLCNTICMLSGWPDSTGARTELAVAKWAGMAVWYEGVMHVYNSQL